MQYHDTLMDLMQCEVRTGPNVRQEMTNPKKHFWITEDCEEVYLTV